jgi:hypothetical protein
VLSAAQKTMLSHVRRLGGCLNPTAEQLDAVMAALSLSRAQMDAVVAAPNDRLRTFLQEFRNGCVAAGLPPAERMLHVGGGMRGLHVRDIVFDVFGVHAMGQEEPSLQVAHGALAYLRMRDNVDNRLTSSDYGIVYVLETEGEPPGCGVSMTRVILAANQSLPASGTSGGIRLLADDMKQALPQQGASEAGTSDAGTSEAGAKRQRVPWYMDVSVVQGQLGGGGKLDDLAPGTYVTYPVRVTADHNADGSMFTVRMTMVEPRKLQVEMEIAGTGATAVVIDLTGDDDDE